jgi:PTS system galactitol-specific IIC component
MGFFDGVAAFFNALQSYGATVLVPMILFIMALAFRAGWAKATRSAITVGVGLLGVNLVLALLQGNVVPAAASMSQRMGISLNIVDIGWPGAAAIAFGGLVGTFIIPLCLLINVIMIATRSTQTANIDVWNFWQHALVGSYIYVITGNVALSFVVAGLSMVICLVLADLTAPYFERYMNLPGCSTPHSFALSFGISGFVLNKLIGVIPGVNKIDFQLDDVQKKLGKAGVFFEPIVLGFIIGFAVGLIAGQPLWTTDAKQVTAFATGMTMAAVMVLVPKMVSLLMEGLIPISDAVQAIIQKRGRPGAKLYIGLDAAVALGQPLSLALSVILTPVMVLLAVGLASLGLNNVMPAVDLVVLPFVFVLIAPIVNGNAFRALVIGVIDIALMLIMTTAFAPIFTQAAVAVGAVKPGEMTSSISGGSNIITFFLTEAVQLAGGPVGVTICGVVAVALAVFNGIRIRRQTSNHALQGTQVGSAL